MAARRKSGPDVVRTRDGLHGCKEHDGLPGTIRIGELAFCALCVSRKLGPGVKLVTGSPDGQAILDAMKGA